MKPIAPQILTAINQALAFLPKPMDTAQARVMLLATGLQESKFEDRWQVVNLNKPQVKGPARGFWQFERGGGCKGVVTHLASRYWMSLVCAWRGVGFNATALWNCIEQDDVLAAAAARLLYFTDPKRLPDLGDEQGAWNLYLRTWRPGAYKRQPKELRAKWAENYAAAMRMVAA